MRRGSLNKKSSMRGGKKNERNKMKRGRLERRRENSDFKNKEKPL